jgi:hypothetical protein
MELVRTAGVELLVREDWFQSMRLTKHRNGLCLLIDFDSWLFGTTDRG